MVKYKKALLEKLDMTGIEAYLSVSNWPLVMTERMLRMLHVHPEEEKSIMDHMCKIFSSNGIEYALRSNLEDDKTTKYWHKRLSQEMHERDKFLLEQLQEDRYDKFKS